MHIFIQARSTSTRLPNKVMLEIAGKPVLQHVYNNCKQALDNVVVLIPFNDPLIMYCRHHNIPYFEGEQLDVLSRYYDAAKEYNATYIIRITSDCPMVNSNMIKEMSAKVIQKKYDFLTNAPVTDGLDIEIISFGLLLYAERYAKEPEHREHVTKFILDKWALLEINGFKLGRHGLKLSIDTMEDYKRVKEIMEASDGKCYL